MEDSFDEFGDPQFEALVEECLVALDSEGPTALERLCARQPERAETLRRRVTPLMAMGLVGRPSTEALPESLGEFLIRERLGGGGMGVVYRAEQPSLRRHVALKIVRPDQLFFPGSRARFRREVEVVASLRHAGIAAVHAVGEEHGVPFFAMELVEGLTLAEVARELRSRPPAALRGEDMAALLASRAREPEPSAGSPWAGPWLGVALGIAQQVALAVDHAHRHGVRHRDIKPTNVMVTASGRVLLMDFGLASMQGNNRLTVSGAAMGTTPYMPPERLRGEKACDDVAGDVYGVGVTLYELLTLQPPFLGADAEATRRLVLDATPPRPRAVNRAVTWEAETVCLAAMEREPRRRYASAAALADDLSRAIERRPILARRAGAWLRARRWIGRHPLTAVGAGLGLLLLVSLSVLVVRENLLQSVRDERNEGPHARDLVARAAELVPSVPAKAPAMREWRAEADDLLARRGAHEDELARLRQRVAPLDAERNRAARPDLVAQLAEAERRLRLAEANDALIADATELATAREELRAAREHLRVQLDERRLWEFADPDDQRRHDELSALVGELDRLSAAVGSVAERQAVVQRLQDLGGDERSGAWSEAIASIAATDAYGGLHLSPQPGLVPLRRNTRTGLWEFWHVESGDRPEADPTPEDPMRLRIDARSGLVFVLVPGGDYVVGADPEQEAARGTVAHPDPHANQFDSPSRAVRLAPYFLATHEVTQAQWQRWTGTNASYFQGRDRARRAEFGPTNPVEQVDRDTALQVAARLGLTLPTEAQWEAACRAGSATEWYTGSEPVTLQGHANIADETFARSRQPTPGGPTLEVLDGQLFHAPVGSFLPNAFGLHDMAGNVAEFCRGDYLIYGASEPAAGDGLLMSLNPLLIPNKCPVRGGSWAYSALEARSAARVPVDYVTRSDFIGVRFARGVHAETP